MRSTQADRVVQQVYDVVREGEWQHGCDLEVDAAGQAVRTTAAYRVVGHAPGGVTDSADQLS
jgi:hypothetical protein